jgi:AcrR family transcriptional regulator
VQNSSSPDFSPDFSPPPRRRRVPALSPDDRRAAVIAATLPLLREHGLSVSTRQIAHACGVAEGTIFGVFPDKPSLVEAALISAFNPEPVLRAIAEIDPAEDLRDRLKSVADILVRRFAENGPLIALLRSPTGNPGGAGTPGTGEFFTALQKAGQCILEAVAEVIEPDRAVLRRSPATTAQLMLMMVMASARGAFGNVETLDGGEIVALLLDGLLIRSPNHPTTGESARC